MNQLRCDQAGLPTPPTTDTNLDRRRAMVLDRL